MSLYRYVLTSLAAAGFAAGLATTRAASASTTYDLANDFSIVNNGGPNNNWTYGRYTGGLDPTTFVPYNEAVPAVFGSIDLWRTAGTTDPNIEKNTDPTNDNSGCCGITWPAGQVAFGPAAGPSVARFTVPVSGTYDISLAFRYIQSGNQAATGYVFYNGDLLGGPYATATHGSLAAGGDGSFISDSGSGPLTAGDVLDFVVADGSKTTEVHATLVLTPEPSACALLGLGAAGLLARRRRHA